MDLSDKEALEAALERLANALHFELPKEALTAYLDGLSPDTAGYEKIVGRGAALPTIGRYTLVAKSFVAQPNLGTFYDIFRAARAIPLVRALDRAITTLRDARIVGLDARLQRLAAATDFDTFDSVLFELVVAARYARVADFEGLEFVQETSSQKTPDLRVRLGSKTIHVECKRIDRMTDAAINLRKEVRAIGRPVLQQLRKDDVAAAIEVQFCVRPSEVSPDLLLDSVRRALASEGTPLHANGLIALARHLRVEPLTDYALFPSPRLYWTRYRYRPSDWHGLVHNLKGIQVGPSWLDQIKWDAALMWRVENDNLLWSIQRLPFTRFFEGIEQLAETGTDTVLHVWFERSAELGHRREHLLKLSEVLEAKSKQFAWIIANETFFDVSIGGRFDFQEHASGLGGTLRGTDEPPVATVFVGEKSLRGIGEWGVGLSLPPIDEEPWSDSGEN